MLHFLENSEGRTYLCWNRDSFKFFSSTKFIFWHERFLKLYSKCLWPGKVILYGVHKGGRGKPPGWLTLPYIFIFLFWDIYYTSRPQHCADKGSSVAVRVKNRSISVPLAQSLLTANVFVLIRLSQIPALIYIRFEPIHELETLRITTWTLVLFVIHKDKYKSGKNEMTVVFQNSCIIVEISNCCVTDLQLVNITAGMVQKSFPLEKSFIPSNIQKGFGRYIPLSIQIVLIRKICALCYRPTKCFLAYEAGGKLPCLLEF